MHRIRPGVLLFAAGILFQLAWYTSLWVSYVGDPKVLAGADFSIFYTVGRIAASGHYDLIYDPQAQIQVQSELQGKTIQAANLLPFNHPPLLVPLQRLIAVDDYAHSYLWWDFIMACFLAATALVVNRIFLVMQWKRGPRLLVVISSLLFYPVFISLLKGQDTAFLLLGAALWLYGVLAGKDLPAGLGVAMCAIRPQIALMLGVLFLFKRRRVLGWIALGGAVQLLAFLPLGLEGTRRYLDMLMASAGGETYIINREAMFNLAGALLRLFPTMNGGILQIVVWGAYFSAIVFLCFLWSRKGDIQIGHLGLVVVLCLLTAPHLHYHDLALLLLPLFCLMQAAARSGWLTPPRAAFAVMGVSLLFLFCDLWSPLRFFFPYLLMIGIPILTWRGEREG